MGYNSSANDDIHFSEILNPNRKIYSQNSFKNVVNYMVMIITLLLQIGFLSSDVYTLIQIYALNDWDSMHSISYVPILAYRIIFTVCIGFSIIYLIVSWGIGIKVYKSQMVSLSYLTETARYINSLQSFEKFCLFQTITTGNKFDWLALTVYEGFHYSFYGWLLADTPRQMLNGATIASTLSNNFSSANIVDAIKTIAQQDNKTEAVLLSFMFFSFMIWVLFTIKYIFIFISLFIVKSKLSKRGEKLTRHCKNFVSDSVLELSKERKASIIDKKDTLTQLDNLEKNPFTVNSKPYSNSKNNDSDFNIPIPPPTFQSYNNNSTSSLDNPFADRNKTFNGSMTQINDPLPKPPVNRTMDSTSSFRSQNKPQEGDQNPFKTETINNDIKKNNTLQTLPQSTYQNNTQAENPFPQPTEPVEQPFYFQPQQQYSQTPLVSSQPTLTTPILAPVSVATTQLPQRRIINNNNDPFEETEREEAAEKARMKLSNKFTKYKVTNPDINPFEEDEDERQFRYNELNNSKQLKSEGFTEITRDSSSANDIFDDSDDSEEIKGQGHGFAEFYKSDNNRHQYGFDDDDDDDLYT